MYCTKLALTSVSGHYSGQAVKMATHLRVMLRLGIRGAVPRLVHMPAVIQQRTIKHRDNFAFTLQQTNAVADMTLEVCHRLTQLLIPWSLLVRLLHKIL